jgi:hypothetical protein
VCVERKEDPPPISCQSVPVCVSCCDTFDLGARFVRAVSRKVGCPVRVRRTTFTPCSFVDQMSGSWLSCAFVAGTSFSYPLYGCPDENPRQLSAQAIPIAHVVGLHRSFALAVGWEQRCDPRVDSVAIGVVPRDEPKPTRQKGSDSMI